jgi:4-hydroxy-L-threonine phosphate dehydrogenase PdxA
MSSRLKIAIPVGDPAGIGPEIALKAALDPAVRAACEPMLVCDEALLARHAKACGLDASRVKMLSCPQPETASLGYGVVSPVAGRASIAFCAAAVKAAMSGEVDAVVAAPQHETSIAQAGIAFDGHPSFVARQTGSDESGGYMMLCFGETRIAHCTLHRSVREAISLVTKENVARTIRAADVALKRLGIV